MNDQEKRVSRSVVSSSIVVHGLLLAALFVTLAWLVPRFWLRFEDTIGGNIPRPFLLAVVASRCVRQWGLLLIPVLAVLLWLDWRFASMLLRRIGPLAATAWSVLIVAALAGFILWLFYALSSPDVWAYHIRHGYLMP